MNATNYGVGSDGGNKEEFLKNPLTILEPEDTPFVSLLNKVDISSTFPEVMSDRLRSPRVTGTREGWSGNKGGNKTAKRKRFGVYPHRWFDEFGVTDVQQQVAKRGGNAATDDEYGYEAAKCLREVKRDIEASLCSSQDCVGGGDDEMKTRGAFKWLDATQTPQVPSDFLPDDTNATITGQATLTEALLNQILKSCKTVHGGSRNYSGIFGNDYVEDLDFLTRTGAANERFRVTHSDSNHEIDIQINVFQTSFGRIQILPSDFLRMDTVAAGDADAGLILRMDLWEFGTLEDLATHDNDSDAGGESGYAKCMGALLCRSPRGNGYIYNA